MTVAEQRLRGATVQGRALDTEAPELGTFASIVRAKSSRRSASRTLIRSSTAARSCDASRRVVSNASVAAAIAASISSGPARWTSATAESS